MGNKWLKKVFAGLGLVGLLTCNAGLMSAVEEGADEQEELRSMLGAVTAQLNDLKTASDKEAKIEGFTDIRFDRQKYTVKGYSNPKTAVKLIDQTQANTDAFFARRAEIKIYGTVAPNAKFSFGYDFNENKVKDLGVEFSDLSLIPFVDLPGWTYSLQVGQYRMKFGIETQTSSSKIYFPERSMLNGGANPFATDYGTVSYTAGAKWKTVSLGKPSTKLVGERAMGVDFIHKKDLGFVKYDLGVSLVNDLAEDQAVGQNKVATAFPKTVTDENPSVAARLGLEPSVLNNLLPFSTKLAAGISYGNDSQNSSMDNTPNGAVYREELVGVDATLEMFKAVKFQGEWVSANLTGNLASMPADSDVLAASDGSIASYGTVNRREAWYALASIKPLNFVSSDAPQIELLGRFETVLPNVNNWSDQLGGNFTAVPGALVYKTNYVSYQLNAASAGIKWTYFGNNHTSVNLTVYGADGNFGAMAGTEMFTVQQQVAF